MPRRLRDFFKKICLYCDTFPLFKKMCAVNFFSLKRLIIYFNFNYILNSYK